jgi:Papain family cysteine protease
MLFTLNLSSLHALSFYFVYYLQKLNSFSPSFLSNHSLFFSFPTLFVPYFSFHLFYSTYDRNGCLAGEVLEAFKYVHNNGGITTDAEYPIVPGASYSVYQKCDLKKKNYAVTVDMTYRIKTEYKMMMYVLSGGTLAVDIDAATWLNYKSGVYSDCSTNFTINHAVNIVGVNVTGKYWIVRNSWGTKWGDKGFMKIQLVSTHLCV